MSYDVVNGYICRNCTDIDYARRNIDPQHPKDGPFGVNRDAQPGHGPAVVLGGALAKPDAARGPESADGVAAVNPASQTDAAPSTDDRHGRRIDVTV